MSLQIIESIERLRGTDMKELQLRRDMHYLYLLTTLRARRKARALREAQIHPLCQPVRSRPRSRTLRESGLRVMTTCGCWSARALRL